MITYGQWKKSQQQKKIPSYAEYVAGKKAESAARLKTLEQEAQSLQKTQAVIDESSWAPVTQGLKARQQEHIGALAEVAGSLGDENAYEVADRDFNANARVAMDRRNRQQALAEKSGVALNRANQQYFDDEGVTPAILDTRAEALRKIISEGRKPGESRATIRNAQQDLALLRQQRMRIANEGTTPETKRQETKPQDKYGLHSLGQAYRAEAQGIRERVAPLEAERGEGMIPNADYIAEKALQTAPDAVIGLGGTVLGGPVAGALMMGGVVAPPAFAERKWEGADNATAAAGAALTAGSEIVGEAIGGAALKGLKLANPFARAGAAIAGDVAGEVATEALNIGTEITLDGKKVTVDEGVKRLIDAGVITAVSSGAVSGGIAYVTKPEAQTKPPVPSQLLPDPVTEPSQPDPAVEPDPVAEPVAPSLEPDYIPSQEDIDFDESASTEAYARATIEAEDATKKAEQLRKKAEITAAVAQETNSPIAIERATKAQAEYDAAQNDALQKTAAIPQIEVDPRVLRDTKKAIKEKEATEVAVAKEREAVLKAETALPPVRKIETIDPANAHEASTTQTIEPVTVMPVSSDPFDGGFDPSAQDGEIATLSPNIPTTLPSTAPQGNTTAEIVKSSLPDADPFEMDLNDGVKATVVPMGDGAAKIYESPSEIWIDVSEVKVGGGGQQIYQAAAARANAVGKKFVPDPLGMSPLALMKRPENLLSAGIKHGSFDFLEPGDQVQNYERGQKADALADQNLKTAVAAYPEIADIVTDGEQFVNAKTGEVISDDTFNRLAAREPLPNVLEGYRAGSRTLKRAAFLNTFSPGRRGTFGVAALAKLRQWTDNALPESLQRFLYSRGKDKVDGITRARAERAVDRALGSGTFTRAIKSGKVKLHATPADYGADADAAAAYEQTTDTIHLFASNLDEKTIAGKFLHEYTHRGFQKAVGGEKNEAEVFSKLRELAKNGDVDAKRAYDAAKGEANVDRETLAYLIENRKNRPINKVLLDTLSVGFRKGLRSFGVKLKESDAEFKAKIYDIALKSLRAQIQADTKRQEGTRELNEPVRDVDFSGLEKRSAFVNESMKTLIDQNFVFEEMNRIIQENGGDVSDSTNIAQRLNTRGSALGEISDRINRLKKEFTDKAIKLKVTLDDIGMWAALQDRAAYDAEVFERTGELNASGLTDAEATAERARLEPQAKALQEMTDMITAIHQEAADVRKNAGLITAEERAKRRKTYVALRGHDNFALHDRSEAAVPGMYGKSVTGKEYRAENARKGRPNYREIAGHAFEDLTKSHARASWNKVVRTIMAFAVAHPNSGIFSFERPEFDAEGKPIGDVNDKVLYGKIKGKLYKVAITHPSAARAIMASAGAPSQAMQIISLPNKLMSYALTTGLTFAGKQVVIDNIEAYTTAVSEQGAKVANDMLKTQPSAISALWRYVNGKPDLNNEVDKKLQEFAQQGGITSFLRDEPASKITKELARKLEPTGIKKATLEELKAIVGSFKSGSEGKTFAEATGQFKDAIADAPGVRNLIGIADFVSRGTKVLENGVRFSFYLSMRKNKPEVTSERAAYLAKELTVNFDRRGELANTLGALFLFYKPIAQSARKTVRLAKNKTFWKLATPALGAAFALGLMNAGFEDEEGNLAIDNVPDYERATGVIIMYGGGKGEYFRIPLPPGLVSIINQIGQGAATIATHSKRGDEKMIQRQLLDMGAGTYNAIAPSLEADGTPSMGAWSVFNHLIRNKDQYGRPIYPEDQSRVPKPKSEQTRGDAGVLADTAASALNYNKWINKGLELVGSSWQWKDEPPIAPLDWSPEEINYLVGSFMPAINKEIATATKYGADYWNRSEAAGSEYAINKAISELGTLPVIKTFVGKPNEGRYYEDFDLKRTEVNREQAQFKEIREKEGDVAAATFRDQSKTMAESMMNRRGLRTTGDDARGRIRRAESDMSNLNKALKKWYNAKELSDELIDFVSKEIDLSDVNTTDFRAYRTVVIDRVREKMNKIRRESVRE